MDSLKEYDEFSDIESTENEYKGVCYFGLSVIALLIVLACFLIFALA